MIARATLVAALSVFATSIAWADDKKKADTTTATEEAPATLLEKTAASYVMLRSDIAAIEKTGMASAKAMRKAHHRLASHDESKLTKSYMAYAALVAADVPAFAEALEAKTKGKKKREAFLKELEQNPVIVRDLPGADVAIAAIMKMTASDATRIGKLGEGFIGEAYIMQKKSWAKKKLSNGMTRVNGAEKWAAARPWPEVTTRPAIRSKAGNVRPNLTAQADWSSTWSETSTVPRADSKSGAMMTRMLILAAHYSLDDLSEQHLTEYAISRQTNRCYSTAKLNFNQCIAATRTPYEEAFCIGKHGLNDISRCVGWPASAGTAK